ncbi:hypothetical protein FB45DRAFT_300554 [Roridomyces roridus]|uniref:Uncharacterized protein n=1 Tax=Roridomyces roridus TaxID=1738132 RepID=A0AAD7FYQ9_9AGAR|nr:hypothetical protein FB45DRAFT_300554 [Roridomyces roridus]
MSSSPPPNLTDAEEAALFDQQWQARMALNGSNDEDEDDDQNNNDTRGTIRTHGEMDAPNNGALLSEDLYPYSVEEGRELKRQKNLRSESDADADAFLKISHPARHAFHTQVVALQCRDMLQQLVADANCNYKLPDTLRKTAVDYGHICMLSYNAKYYRNPKDTPAGYLVGNIIAAMRAMGVKDLPPAMETGRVAVLAKVIGKALTDKRFEIKSQVVKSLEGKENPSNIAALTRACIGSATSVKPTAALYQRIAIIRSVAVKNMDAATATSKPGEDSKDKFWPLVDQRLETWRKSLTAPGALQGMYAKTYDEDVAKYGAPDAGIAVTAMKDVESWLVTLSGAMEK